MYWTRKSKAKNCCSKTKVSVLNCRLRLVVKFTKKRLSLYLQIPVTEPCKSQPLTN